MQQGNYDTLIRKTYGDFEVGDLDLLKVVMADDVVWHEPGRNPLAGDHRGPDGVLALLAELKQRSGDTFQIEVLDVFSNAERAVVLQRETASSNGKRFTTILPSTTFARLLSLRRTAPSCACTKRIPPAQTCANASLA